MDEKEQAELRKLSFKEILPAMAYAGSPVDQDIVDEIRKYIRSLTGPTKDCAFYKNLLVEMEQGPQSPGGEV